jgi:hypothetical protein
MKPATWQFWDGYLLQSTRDCPLALDTETELIEDARRLPQLALAVASDGRTNAVIHPDRLGAFLKQHGDAYFVGHNFGAFDFWVINKHLKASGEEKARRILWDACDQGRIFDTQILDLLLQLATGKFRKTGRSTAKENDTKVYPGNLAEVAADYTSYRISKDDPFRRRFGDLVDLTFDKWNGVEPGFFEYAVRDAIVTRQLYPALTEVAAQQMKDSGFDRKAGVYDIRPDAIDRFGYLSEVIQVKASVALAYLFRRGVRVNLVQARTLEQKHRSELDEIVAELERDYREVLSYAKDGTLQLTPKSQTPSLANKKLEEVLQRVANELKAAGHLVDVPTSDGKHKRISISVKEWKRYAPQHRFLDLWVRLKHHEKMLGFLKSFTAGVMHGEYTLLKRTGRTSCSRPRDEQIPGMNIQQMPKLPEFRALFVPDPGHKLFVGDFVAAELRTLAAVCRAKFGTSNLGDVITKNVDPHAFTAAAIQGMTIDEFQELKITDSSRYKQGRTRSKPINFGVPGGMGARSLMEYARAEYGVTFTLEEAQQFRKTLIEEVYPELNSATGYLADNSMETLASNLGVTEREVWEVVDRSGERSPIAARGVTNVIRGKSTASMHYQERVWNGLSRLLRTVPDPNPEIDDLIHRKQGGPRLDNLLCRQIAATLTGRLRSGVGYTDSKNTPFQSLCADGGKLALWNLLYAEYDIYAFVHDEVLVQLPEKEAEQAAKNVAQIMEDSMEAVMGQQIPAQCEYGVSDHWAKP